MAKFCGKVGYSTITETASSVYEEPIVERTYYGDIPNNTRKLRENEKVNDDIIVSNDISIIADAYAFGHYFNIKYVEFSGVKWKVTSVSVKRPRLILSLGGVYNE